MVDRALVRWTRNSSPPTGNQARKASLSGGSSGGRGGRPPGEVTAGRITSATLRGRTESPSAPWIDPRLPFNADGRFAWPAHLRCAMGLRRIRRASPCGTAPGPQPPRRLALRGTPGSKGRPSRRPSGPATRCRAGEGEVSPSLRASSRRRSGSRVAPRRRPASARRPACPHRRLRRTSCESRPTRHQAHTHTQGPLPPGGTPKLRPATVESCDPGAASAITVGGKRLANGSRPGVLYPRDTGGLSSGHTVRLRH